MSSPRDIQNFKNKGEIVVDMNSLPDLCLDYIFDCLPLPDLVSIVPLVCRRWYDSWPSACHRRRTLLLLEHEDEVESVLKRHLNMDLIIDYVVDSETGDWVGDPVDNQTHLEKSGLVLQNLGRRISFNQLSTGLLPLFANITDLRLVFRTNLRARDLMKVHLILLRLAPNLTTLHLILWVHKLDICIDDDFEGLQHVAYHHFSLIFELINTLMRPNLRRLHLNLQVPEHGSRALQPLLFNLSILDQLDEFDFRSCRLSSQSDRLPYDRNEPFEALERYAATNPYLHSIKLYNPMDLQYCIRLPASVARSFTELAIGDWVSESMNAVQDFREFEELEEEEEDVGGREDLRALTLFGERFSSVRDLSLSFTHTLAWEQIVACLGGLKQLAHLTLSSEPNLSAYRRYTAEELEQYGRDLAMPSVIALSLFVSTESHEDLELLQLPVFFPNTQVVLLRHDVPTGCCECAIDHAGSPDDDQGLGLFQGYEEEDLLEAKRGLMVRCMELAIRPFAHFQKLRQLKANELPLNFPGIEETEDTDVSYTREVLAGIPSGR